MRPEPERVTAPEADPIVDLIQKGDLREAVALAARTHGAVVGRLCMALLGSQAEAEEALQDTLLAAHGALASYRGEGTFKAWLYGIARRVCARRLEARTMAKQKLRLVHDAEADAVLPEEQAEERQRAREVRALLERLTPTEREAVVLRYQSELSYREIADACGIDEATARKRASRGLDRLRTLIAGETP